MYHQSLSISVTSTLFLVISQYSHSLLDSVLTGKNLHCFEIFSSRYKVVSECLFEFLGRVLTVVQIVHCTTLKVPFSHIVNEDFDLRDLFDYMEDTFLTIRFKI